MNKENLKEEGIFHPVKLEYYKVEEKSQTKNSEIYGIEVIKTEYIGQEVKVEKANMSSITEDEKIANNILNRLKQGEVTPVVMEYIVHDLIMQE